MAERTKQFQCQELSIYQLYTIDGIVLLVTRYYVCNSGDRYLSHDERILDRLPSSAHLRFILTHRSGPTMQYLSLIISLVGEGKKSRRLNTLC